jgi:hypothetical protein
VANKTVGRVGSCGIVSKWDGEAVVELRASGVVMQLWNREAAV